MINDALGFGLRTKQHEGRLYFYLRDISQALRAGPPSRIAETLDPDEFITLDMITGKPSDTTTFLVTEPAVFKIALRMHSKAARALVRFVCHEVLPRLREGRPYRLPRKANDHDGAALVRFLRGPIAQATASSAAPVAAALQTDVPW